MATLHDVVRAGKARYIGASTMRAWQFAKAQHTARTAGWTAFVSMQNRYNLLNREDEREMIPLCLDQGVGLIPYSPLARSLLAGTRERSGVRHTLRSGTDDLLRSRSEDFDVIDTVRAIATQRSLPPAQMALAWLLAKPGLSAPIIGATQARHLDEAVPALEVTLTGDETARLEAQYRPHLDGEYTWPSIRRTGTSPEPSQPRRATYVTAICAPEPHRPHASVSAKIRRSALFLQVMAVSAGAFTFHPYKR